MELMRDKEPKVSHKGTNSKSIITLRVLEETRQYLSMKARDANVSVNEYIKQKLGIQTIRIMQRENNSIIEEVIENIYE
jgi:predicted HicB family RNase H-like nuclease